MPARVPQIRTRPEDLVPNIAGAQQNALRTQGMGTRNALMDFDLKTGPRRMEMDEQSLRIRQGALDAEQETLRLGRENMVRPDWFRKQWRRIH